MNIGDNVNQKKRRKIVPNGWCFPNAQRVHSIINQFLSDFPKVDCK